MSVVSSSRTIYTERILSHPHPLVCTSNSDVRAKPSSVLLRCNVCQLFSSFFASFRETIRFPFFCATLTPVFSFTRPVNLKRPLLANDRSHGESIFGLTRLCFACILSRVISQFLSSMQMRTVFLPSDQQYLLMASPWRSLSASAPARSSH